MAIGVDKRETRGSSSGKEGSDQLTGQPAEQETL